MPEWRHIGRSWGGPGPKEESCPCGKAPCGLVDVDKIDPSCPDHPHGRAKTMRSSHFQIECPAMPQRVALSVDDVPTDQEKA